MILPAVPRTRTEINLYVHESPCERCGHVGLKFPEPSYKAGTYNAYCESCELRREFHFTPMLVAPFAKGFQLTNDPTPSKLFDAPQLRTIVDREMAQVPRVAAELPTMAAYDTARVHLVKALNALGELAKFHPDDVELRAEVAAGAALWGEYERAKAVIDAKPGAHPAPIGLGDRFAQHRAWLARGRIGDGRIEFRYERWHGLGMATGRLHHAIFIDSTFEAIDFSYGEMHDATTTRTRFLGCDFLGIELDRARLEDTDMTGSSLALASLRATSVTGGNWQRIRGGRGTWTAHLVGVDLREASLRDTVLDDAVFERCDLRGADFSRRDEILTKLGTARRTRFVECDLRGANVTGWRLDGAVFERCKMFGFLGAPVFEGDVQVLGADLTQQGDGSVLGASWPR
ncbi:MAG: pentapeptide repeat-containing protein [Polyangiaceae bacterium]